MSFYKYVTQGFTNLQPGNVNKMNLSRKSNLSRWLYCFAQETPSLSIYMAEDYNIILGNTRFNTETIATTSIITANDEGRLTIDIDELVGTIITETILIYAYDDGGTFTVGYHSSDTGEFTPGDPNTYPNVGKNICEISMTAGMTAITDSLIKDIRSPFTSSGDDDEVSIRANPYYTTNTGIASKYGNYDYEDDVVFNDNNSHRSYSINSVNGRYSFDGIRYFIMANTDGIYIANIIPWDGFDYIIKPLSQSDNRIVIYKKFKGNNYATPYLVTSHTAHIVQVFYVIGTKALIGLGVRGQNIGYSYFFLDFETGMVSTPPTPPQISESDITLLSSNIQYHWVTNNNNDIASLSSRYRINEGGNYRYLYYAFIKIGSTVYRYLIYNQTIIGGVPTDPLVLTDGVDFYFNTDRQGTPINQRSEIHKFSGTTGAYLYTIDSTDTSTYFSITEDSITKDGIIYSDQIIFPKNISLGNYTSKDGSVSARISNDVHSFTNLTSFPSSDLYFLPIPSSIDTVSFTTTGVSSISNLSVTNIAGNNPLQNNPILL